MMLCLSELSSDDTINIDQPLSFTGQRLVLEDCDGHSRVIGEHFDAFPACEVVPSPNLRV